MLKTDLEFGTGRNERCFGADCMPDGCSYAFGWHHLRRMVAQNGVFNPYEECRNSPAFEALMLFACDEVLTKQQRNHLVLNVFGALSTYHHGNTKGAFNHLLLKNLIAWGNDLLYNKFAEEEDRPPYWSPYNPSDYWDGFFFFQVNLRRFVYAHSHSTLAETIDMESKFFVWCALLRGMTSLNRIHKAGRGVFARHVNLGYSDDAKGDACGWNANPSVKLTLQFLRNCMQICAVYEQITCNERRSQHAFPHVKMIIGHLFRIAGLAPLPDNLHETDAIRLSQNWWHDEIRQGCSDYNAMIISMTADRPSYHSGRSENRFPRYDPTQTNELLSERRVDRVYAGLFQTEPVDDVDVPGEDDIDNAAPSDQHVPVHSVVRRG